MSNYTCTVCGYTTYSGLGISQHSVKHKNEFEKVTGRECEDYEGVREIVGSIYNRYGDFKTFTERALQSKTFEEFIEPSKAGGDYE